MSEVMEPTTAAGTGASPVPGWYADPHFPDGLRFWDGQRWTENRRPSGDPVASQGPPRRQQPWRGIVAAIVGLAVIIGLVVVLTHHGGSTSRATSPAATKPQPIPAACSDPEPRPGASDVLWWFSVHGKLPSVAKPKVRATIPAGGCSAEAFTDSRVGSATSVVVSMPTADQATALAQSIGGSAFAEGQYVVELNPRLQSFADAYKASLAAFVKANTLPTTPGGSASP